MRVRNFTQDDAHIFMLPEQIKDEVKGVIDLIDDFIMSLDSNIMLSFLQDLKIAWGVTKIGKEQPLH